jgi:hypothetical protein
LRLLRLYLGALLRLYLGSFKALLRLAAAADLADVGTSTEYARLIEPESSLNRALIEP